MLLRLTATVLILVTLALHAACSTSGGTPGNGVSVIPATRPSGETTAAVPDLSSDGRTDRGQQRQLIAASPTR
jgi:hypothetical protein